MLDDESPSSFFDEIAKFPDALADLGTSRLENGQEIPEAFVEQAPYDRQTKISVRA